MTSKFVLSTLSVDGWINQPLQVIDTMLADFFLSEYSQTFAFPDSVASFPWILQQYRGDIDILSRETQRRLVEYFDTQFHDVNCEVTNQLNPGSINSSALVIFLEMKDVTGELFSLSRLIKYNDLKVTEINKILQNG